MSIAVVTGSARGTWGVPVVGTSVVAVWKTVVSVTVRVWTTTGGISMDRVGPSGSGLDSPEENAIDGSPGDNGIGQVSLVLFPIEPPLQNIIFGLNISFIKETVLLVNNHAGIILNKNCNIWL